MTLIETLILLQGDSDSDLARSGVRGTGIEARNLKSHNNLTWGSNYPFSGLAKRCVLDDDHCPCGEDNF